MRQSVKKSAQHPQQKWDLSEFDVRQRWRIRPPKEFPSPWACEWGFDEYGLWQVFSIKGPNGPVKHKMRFIPRGTFLMGSPEDEPERHSDETQHQVELTQGFWLGETVVTQALWEAVTGETPSKFAQRDDEQLPVEQVSWDDCMGFCDQLNQLKPGISASLPTEAQWEYACRAGTQTPFNTGEQLTTELANYNGKHPYDGRKQLSDEERAQQTYKEKTVDVNLFKPNHWGLKQMHGNVWEWCMDYWDEQAYSSDAVKDPIAIMPSESTKNVGKESKEEKESRYVVRGGGWIFFARNCRSAYRSRHQRGFRFVDLGLRLCVRSTPYSQENR